MSPKHALGGSSAEEGRGFSLGQGVHTDHSWGALRAPGAVAGAKLWETRDWDKSRCQHGDWGWEGAVSRAHLMEQVGLQQGRFITQGRMRGLCGQQQMLQERGQQLSLQRGQGGARPSSTPACGRSRKPVLRSWGGASGDAL